MCVTCGRVDQDMIYNKIYDAWYCTECYKRNRKHAVLRAHLRYEDDSEEPGHEDRTMDELSRNFL